MKIKSLNITNFRNYEKIKVSFNDSLNIIYGLNGVGKTNLVEAIYVLALTKSFRTNVDKNLIKNGELSLKIEGEVEKSSLDSYQVIINKEGKKVKINNNLQSKISDYISNINIILLEPDEQRIFDLAPSARRKLLNIEISQLNKEYIFLLNDYNKLLKQRNFYLREMFINGNKDRSYLDILTDKLVDNGLKIHHYRLDFINKINEYINEFYNEIFGFGNVIIKYLSDYSQKNKDDLIKSYKKYYDKEISIGKTAIGIHHDDIIFELDNKNINEWGSNGQRKNSVLAFKLAEIRLFEKEKNEEPILILDDVFSALDNEKIKNIVKLLNNNIQTFITTTDLDKIDKKLLENANLFKVENNSIREINNGR